MKHRCGARGAVALVLHDMAKKFEETKKMRQEIRLLRRGESYGWSKGGAYCMSRNQRMLINLQYRRCS